MCHGAGENLEEKKSARTILFLYIRYEYIPGIRQIGHEQESGRCPGLNFQLASNPPPLAFR